MARPTTTRSVCRSTPYSLAPRYQAPLPASPAPERRPRRPSKSIASPASPLALPTGGKTLVPYVCRRRPSTIPPSPRRGSSSPAVSSMAATSPQHTPPSPTSSDATLPSPRSATSPASTSAGSTPCVVSSSMPRRSCSKPPVVREKSSAKLPYSTIPQRPNLPLPVEKTLPPSHTSPSSPARRRPPYSVPAFPSSSGRSSKLRAHARLQRRLLLVRSAQAPNPPLSLLPSSAPLRSLPRARRASIACSVWHVYAATPPTALPSTSLWPKYSLPPTSAKPPAPPFAKALTRRRPYGALLPKPTPA